MSLLQIGSQEQLAIEGAHTYTTKLRCQGSNYTFFFNILIKYYRIHQPVNPREPQSAEHGLTHKVYHRWSQRTAQPGVGNQAIIRGLVKKLPRLAPRCRRGSANLLLKVPRKKNIPWPCPVLGDRSYVQRSRGRRQLTHVYKNDVLFLKSKAAILQAATCCLPAFLVPCVHLQGLQGWTECLTTGSPQLVTFAHFCGVNTPSLADFN